MSEGNPSAGWYDDPESPGMLRYWDGTAWTDHRSPAPGSAPAASAASGGQAAGPPVVAAGGELQTWMWQSIVVTVLCCMPFGIVGIVMASQAQTALAAGDHATATQKAGQARLFTLIGGGVGILAWVAILFFLMVPFALMPYSMRW